MTVYVITTEVLENYAAHENGFTGEYRWKSKFDETYIVEGVKSISEAQEVIPFITTPDSDEYRETVLEIFEAADDYQSQFVKDQMEYDLGDTVYCDNVIRKGKDGNWYRKRGHIVGQYVNESFAHLKGKFVGFIDNLTLGKCVRKIEGDKVEVMA